MIRRSDGAAPSSKATRVRGINWNERVDKRLTLCLCVLYIRPY
jgi:hypothetical protein